MLPLSTGIVEAGSSTPNTPSPTASFCPRHNNEARGHNPNRYSTSSLPVVASNEWITYHDTATPVTVGALDGASGRRRRGARPHTADEVFEIGSAGVGRGETASGQSDRRPLSRLRKMGTAETVPKVQRNFTCPVMTTALTQAENTTLDKRARDEAEVDGDQNAEERSLASSGVLSHLSMAVDYAPTMTSDFNRLAVAVDPPVNRDREGDVRPTLPPLTIRLSDDDDTVPTGIAPESALSHTDALSRHQTFRVFVSVLDSKIAVVGLNKETERQWEHRVQVFLNYPEEQSRVVNNRYTVNLAAGNLCDTRSRNIGEHDSVTPTRNGKQFKRPFISYIQTEDGTSLSTEIPIIRSLFQVDEREGLVQSGGELGIFDDDEDEHEENGDVRRDRSDGSARKPSGSHDRPHERGDSRASSCGSRNMFDSGYGSAFGAPPWSATGSFDDEASKVGADVKNEDDVAICEYAQQTDRKPERGVKRCLQLDFRQLESHGSGVDGEGHDGLGKEVVYCRVCLLDTDVSRTVGQTRLIARVSGRLQRRGLGLL